jgi:hypothetical protein
MPLASADDANRLLDGTKIRFANESNAADEQTRADRIIRAALYDLFPDEVDTWDVDTFVPGLVKEIASMFMAGFRYNRIYSQETLGSNSYGRGLVNDAEQLLEDIREGRKTLVDVPVVVDVTGSPSFYPNDQTVDLDNFEPLRFFNVEDEW